MVAFLFFVTSFVSIFVTLDAIGNIPIFLSIPPHNTQSERAELISRALLTVLAVLLIFALFGILIFRVFGATIESFRIVAGPLLLRIAFDIMEATPRARRTAEEDSKADLISHT